MRVFGRIIGRIAAALLLIGLAVITVPKWIAPATTSVLIQENLANHRAPDQWVGFTWAPWEALSPELAVAVLAAEDQRFPDHHGLDFIELSRALQADSGQRRGASTVTQQVAKNLFLWQGRSYVRKALEAMIALYIDLVWGKQRVLEVYLNIVQYGPDVYGAQNAAQHYFDKDASALNRYEAARLAAVLPSPNRRSAAHASDNVVKRQAWIMEQVRNLGGTGLLDKL